MSRADKPITAPVENTTPRKTGPSAEQWIMKGLNDLREDVRELKTAIGNIDTRVASLEKHVLRVVYGIAGAMLVASLAWGVWKAANSFFDIEIKSKSDVTEQTP